MVLPASTKQLIGFTLLSLILLTVLWPAISMAEKQEETLEALLAQSNEVTTQAQSKALLDKIDQYLAKELTSLDTHIFVSAADAYGNLVSTAQETGASQTDFNYLLLRGEGFFKRCRAKVRDLEQATGDQEAGLEKLYRSDLWHNINYALSAFNYWQAWSKLGLAYTYQGQRE